MFSLCLDHSMQHIMTQSKVDVFHCKRIRKTQCGRNPLFWATFVQPFCLLVCTEHLFKILKIIFNALLQKWRELQKKTAHSDWELWLSKAIDDLWQGLQWERWGMKPSTEAWRKKQKFNDPNSLLATVQIQDSKVVYYLYSQPHLSQRSQFQAVTFIVKRLVILIVNPAGLPRSKITIQKCKTWHARYRNSAFTPAHRTSQVRDSKFQGLECSKLRSWNGK